MIVAKPVIDQQFWILQRDEEKIGNVEAFAGGYQVELRLRESVTLAAPVTAVTVLCQ